MDCQINWNLQFVVANMNSNLISSRLGLLKSPIENLNDGTCVFLQRVFDECM